MAGVALFKTVNDALPLHVCIHQLKIPFLGASRINYISANAAQHQSVEAKKYKSEALTFHRWIEAIPQTNIQFYRFIQGMQNAVMTCLAIFLDNWKNEGVRGHKIYESKLRANYLAQFNLHFAEILWERVYHDEF